MYMHMLSRVQRAVIQTFIYLVINFDPRFNNDTPLRKNRRIVRKKSDNLILHSKILISLAFRQHSLGLKILSKKMMFSHDISIKIDLKKMSMYIELNVDNKITITYISHYYL